MKKITYKVLPVFLTALFVLLSACSGGESEKSFPLKKGKYSYILTDSMGTSLVEGEMMLNSITKQKDVGEDNYVVDGSYTITKANSDTTYIGFGTMSGGELKGYFNEKTKLININNNPMIADANVFLNGKVTGSVIEGTWNFSTFRGAGNEAGMFKAAYIKK